MIFFICVSTGYLGVHRFVEGKVKTGLIWLFTCGVYGFGWVHDIFYTFRKAYRTPQQCLDRHAKSNAKKVKRKAQKYAIQEKIKDRINRIKQMDEEGVPYCPKCKSPHLSANKQGFGVGKALCGVLVFNAIGLLAGGIRKNRIRVTCLKCGYRFRAGE